MFISSRAKSSFMTCLVVIFCSSQNDLNLDATTPTSPNCGEYDVEISTDGIVTVAFDEDGKSYSFTSGGGSGSGGTGGTTAPDYFVTVIHTSAGDIEVRYKPFGPCYSFRSKGLGTTLYGLICGSQVIITEVI